MSTEHLSYFHFPVFPLSIRAAMTKITFPNAVLSGPPDNSTSSLAAINMTSFVYRHPYMHEHLVF